MKPASVPFISIIVLLITACTTASQSETKSGHTLVVANQIQASWVEIGEQGQAIARVVTESVNCPDLNQDGTLVAMRTRAEPANLAQRPVSSTNATPSSEKPAAFPVLICELPLKPGISAASIGGKPLPLPK